MALWESVQFVADTLRIVTAKAAFPALLVRTWYDSFRTMLTTDAVGHLMWAYVIPRQWYANSKTPAKQMVFAQKHFC